MGRVLPAPTAPTRVLLATVGVGVPTTDAPLLIGALAAEAGRLGYRHLVVENDQVSGTLPEGAEHRSTPDTCPTCLRRIRRYPGGRFYTHRCDPTEDA